MLWVLINSDSKQAGWEITGDGLGKSEKGTEHKYVMAMSEGHLAKVKLVRVSAVYIQGRENPIQSPNSENRCNPSNTIIQ